MHQPLDTMEKEKNRNVKYKTKEIISNIIVPLLLTFSFQNGNSQNLVPNPSFEETQLSYFLPRTFCQNENEFNENLNNWETVHSTTPDLLHPGFKRIIEIGNPIDGVTMIGLFNLHNWYEDVTVKLIKPLEIGKTYYAEFWIARSKNRFNEDALQKQFIGSNFGLLFTEGTPKQEKRTQPIDGIPQISCPEKLWLTTKWEKITGYFKPDKNYEYLTIGHFKDSTILQSSLISGYVLVDNLKIEELSSFDQLSNISNIPNEGIITPLNEIYFEDGKSEILNKSIPSLEQIHKYLTDNPDIQIKINGHTDNKGSKSDNLILSENRAKSIINYLIEKGIDENRMKFEGYGELLPKYDNSTKYGRSRNRRVEIELIKKTVSNKG